MDEHLDGWMDGKKTDDWAFLPLSRVDLWVKLTGMVVEEVRGPWEVRSGAFWTTDMPTASSPPHAHSQPLSEKPVAKIHLMPRDTDLAQHKHFKPGLLRRAGGHCPCQEPARMHPWEKGNLVHTKVWFPELCQVIYLVCPFLLSPLHTPRPLPLISLSPNIFY